MKCVIVIGALALIACGSPSPRSPGQWRRVDAGAQPFDQSRAACKAYALKKSEGVTGQGLAAKAAAGAFAECMRERGWALVDAE